MLTDLQIRKLTRRFNVTDLDGNGVLEYADFDRFSRNVCTILGIGLDTPQHLDIAAVMNTWWDQMCQSMDQNHDSQITLDEWLAFHEHAIAGGVFTPLIEGMTEGGLKYFDVDGDGKLSAAEFGIFFQAMELDSALADEVFRRLDSDGDGYLNPAEAYQRVEEFFVSDDPNAPGNWMFGDY